MKENSRHLSTIRALGRELVRELGVVDSASSYCGLSLSQCHLLVELEQKGTLTANELTSLLLIDKSAVSRTVNQLMEAGFISFKDDAIDRRRKPLVMTAAGAKKLSDAHRQANQRVSNALEDLSTDEEERIIDGLSLYVRALSRTRVQKNYHMRPMEKADHPKVRRLIEKVMAEFGERIDSLDIAKDFKGAKALFLVVEKDGEIVGCGGLREAGKTHAATCEVQRMYLLPEVRGLGLGRLLLKRCLEAARRFGYRRCYLETKSNMLHAQKLYERFGFVRMKQSLSAEKKGCDMFYMKDL